MWSSQACEHEVDVSAMIDGELDLPSMLKAVDHLEACPGCRAFYRAARALERELDVTLPLADASLVSTDHATAPGSTLRETAHSESLHAGLPGAASSIRRLWNTMRPSGWTWGAAAVVAVLFAVVLTQVVVESDLVGRDMTNVVLEGEPDQMDDARFRELVTELLQSDRKYHRAMLHALRDVEQLAYIPEGSAELPRTAPLQ